ncbi:MAG TPA: response regulator [Thermoleophilaceae bacterium]
MATVLVVEDRPTDRELLVTLLSNSGYEVLECDAGDEALRITRERRPDLVIAHMLVPDMDGLALAHTIRAEHDISSTPIIIYTATYEAWELEPLARAAGVSNVLHKPADPEQILRAVAECVAGAGGG